MAERKVKITYRGWPGHFICVSRCLFRLNTLIECGRRRVVVSSVGMMRDEKGEYETIGIGRHYETMAFWAYRNGEFWDADVSKQIPFDAKWAWPNIEDEAKAQAGHETVVAEIAGKLEREERFGTRR